MSGGALIVPDRRRAARELGKEESSLNEREVEVAVWSRVERVNEGIEYYERIRKIVLLREDFSERVRSVTAFQKIKIDRKVVEEMYSRDIEGIYL